MKIISVVRNFDMYNRLVKKNHFYPKGTEFIYFDNTLTNKAIPKRYNEFLDNYDYTKDDWFVFCHEDWELKENLELKLKNLNKNFLYGPIGMNFGKLFKKSILTGFCFQSDKKNSNIKKLGKIASSINVQVSTLDCQCIIIHSSLINKYKLHFDENLTFDLYVEDFCINAMENYGIQTRICFLNCQHYSPGNVTEHFYYLLKYLRNKYKKVEKIYCTTVNGRSICSPIMRLLYNCSILFYKKQITSTDYLLVKILKIPVIHKKIK